MNPTSDHPRPLSKEALISTGMPGLDALLTGLRPGDNVVWEVEGIEDYLPYRLFLLRDEPLDALDEESHVGENHGPVKAIDD